MSRGLVQRGMELAGSSPGKAWIGLIEVRHLGLGSGRQGTSFGMGWDGAGPSFGMGWPAAIRSVARLGMTMAGLVDRNGVGRHRYVGWCGVTRHWRSQVRLAVWRVMAWIVVSGW